MRARSVYNSLQTRRVEKTIHRIINDATFDMGETIISDSNKKNIEKNVISTREVRNTRTRVHDQVRITDWIPETAMNYTIFVGTLSRSFY